MIIFTYTIYKDYNSYKKNEPLTHFSTITEKEYKDRLKDLSKSFYFKENSPTKYLFHVKTICTEDKDIVENTCPLFEDII